MADNRESNRYAAAAVLAAQIIQWNGGRPQKCSERVEKKEITMLDSMFAQLFK